MPTEFQGSTQFSTIRLKLKRLIVESTLILSVFALAGCSTLGLSGHKRVESPPIQAPVAAPLALGDVQWRVLTRSELEKLLSENPGDITLFALDERSYKVFETNLVEIKRYITEQKAVILFYQKANEK